MIGSQDGGLRLLPWVGPEGKPCYLVGDGIGRLSRFADTVEFVQLGMACELLDHAADMLADRKATSAQLHFLVARMAEALRMSTASRRAGEPALPRPSTTIPVYATRPTATTSPYRGPEVTIHAAD